MIVVNLNYADAETLLEALISYREKNCLIDMDRDRITQLKTLLSVKMNEEYGRA